MSVGLFAGSFDPVHVGHMSLIAGAAEQFDRLVVVVASNPEKQTGLFTVDERLEMLSSACRSLQNVRILAHHGLLIEIAKQFGADVLVRGGGKGRGDEMRMAYLNGCEGLPTVLVPPEPAKAFISSSQVRSLIGIGAVGRLDCLVPTSVVAAANRRYPGGRSEGDLVSQQSELEVVKAHAPLGSTVPLNFGSGCDSESIF